MSLSASLTTPQTCSTSFRAPAALGRREHRLSSVLYETRPDARAELVRLSAAHPGDYAIWKGTTHIEPPQWGHTVMLADGTLVPPLAGHATVFGRTVDRERRERRLARSGDLRHTSHVLPGGRCLPGSRRFIRSSHFRSCAVRGVSGRTRASGAGSRAAGQQHISETDRVTHKPFCRGEKSHRFYDAADLVSIRDFPHVTRSLDGFLPVLRLSEALPIPSGG